MKLKELQKNWEAFGNLDPLWAILTVPGKEGGRWDPEEFFSTGRQEIDAVMDEIKRLGFKLRKNRALDFGCGAGRLTQGLCRYFKRCDGVDIAESMIMLARKSNKFGKRCVYHHNDADDLSLFPDNSFTFIYSCIVLQHIDPVYSRKYIKDFFRVLAKGGLAAFHIPSERLPESRAVAEAPVTRPLGPDDYRARISVNEMPSTLEAGRSYEISIRVRNESSSTWPGRSNHPGGMDIKLGNHWLNQAGDLLTMDDGRALLLHHLHPQQETDLRLAIKAPMSAGSYQLEFDMVHECVAWFKDRGSKALRLPVTVTKTKTDKPAAGVSGALAGDSSSQCAPQAADPAFSPKMEMHGIPRLEIHQMIKDAGCKLLQELPNPMSGDEWVSYSYYVGK
jgi:ubiquinone/menaquinone biosynthesis C-methylase UbiE